MVGGETYELIDVVKNPLRDSTGKIKALYTVFSIPLQTSDNTEPVRDLRLLKGRENIKLKKVERCVSDVHLATAN